MDDSAARRRYPGPATTSSWQRWRHFPPSSAAPWRTGTSRTSPMSMWPRSSTAARPRLSQRRGWHRGLRATYRRDIEAMNDDPLTRAIIGDLAAAADDGPDGLDGLRRGLAEAAEQEGLLDLAYRVVESPVGDLLVVTTSTGLVRLAFDLEDQSRSWPISPSQVSPRILESAARTDAAAASSTSTSIVAAGASTCRSTSGWSGAFVARCSSGYATSTTGDHLLRTARRGGRPATGGPCGGHGVCSQPRTDRGAVSSSGARGGCSRNYLGHYLGGPEVKVACSSSRARSERTRGRGRHQAPPISSFTSASTVVPAKKSGFVPAKRRATLPNMKSRELVSIDQVVLDELPGLGEDASEVGDVPVADVGGEHRLQAAAARVDPVVEGEAFIGSSASQPKKERCGEDVDDVGGRAHTARRPLVEGRRVLVGVGQERQRVVELVDAVGERGVAEALDERRDSARSRAGGS